MKKNNITLEKSVAGISVRVSPEAEETIDEAYRRLVECCERIKQMEKMRLAVGPFKTVFCMTREERSESGLKNDYHFVILSLLKHFNKCMGSSEIAKEWNVNSGRISRVFTGSRSTYEKYKEHFTKCQHGSYQMTPKGLHHALEEGLSEIQTLLDS